MVAVVAKVAWRQMPKNVNTRPIVVVGGPTASGKSGLAMKLAERFDGEIINADSMQIYRELPILSARPSTADETRVPHHLYGVISVADGYSAGQWLQMAEIAISDVCIRGKLPIICGGTGLYLKVLMEGIAPVPPVPEDAALAARALYDELGGDAFKARLTEIDPDGAAKLPAADHQRLIRAYAVKTATGRTLAEWQADQSVDPGVDGKYFTILLAPPRDALYARIEARFDAMVDLGGLKEAQALGAQGLDPSLPGLKALGMPNFLAHLAGTCTLDDAIEKAKQTTRNFAKRQTTWFRHQISADLEVPGFGDGAEAGAVDALARFLG
jgi:tRNA dimethylallyltransferase